MNGWEIGEMAKKSAGNIVGKCETIKVEEKTNELRCIIDE
jgi:hypothetical protein